MFLEDFWMFLKKCDLSQFIYYFWHIIKLSYHFYCYLTIIMLVSFHMGKYDFTKYLPLFIYQKQITSYEIRS